MKKWILVCFFPWKRRLQRRMKKLSPERNIRSVFRMNYQTRIPIVVLCDDHVLQCTNSAIGISDINLHRQRISNDAAWLCCATTRQKIPLMTSWPFWFKTGHPTYLGTTSYRNITDEGEFWIRQMNHHIIYVGKIGSERVNVSFNPYAVNDAR